MEPTNYQFTDFQKLGQDVHRARNTFRSDMLKIETIFKFNKAKFIGINKTKCIFDKHSVS